MPDDQIDFNRLAREALRGAYDPRARRCWPWTHAWTMWVTEGGQRWQTRRCTGCGKVQIKRLRRTCVHDWRLIQHGPITRNGARLGTYHHQRCTHCGDMRHVELR